MRNLSSLFSSYAALKTTREKRFIMKRHFDQSISRIGTYCTQWDYMEDRFGSSDLLPFSISDMDFKSPPEMIQAIQKRTSHGIFGYTRWNHEDYKSSIAGWYKRRFDNEIPIDWVIYSPSVIYSIARLIEILNLKAIKWLCRCLPTMLFFMSFTSRNGS